MNIEQLKKNRSTALKLVEDEGIRICFDEVERERAKQFLLPLFRVFEKELTGGRLSLVYLYRQSEQRERFSWCDGQCNVFIHPSGKRRIIAIGLSVELMSAPSDYAAMVFMHEMAHMRYNGKSPFFFLYMDRLISRYNKATGASVVNDYKEK